MEEIEAKENVDCKPDRKKIMGKMRENPWMLSTIVLGVLFLGLLFGGIGFNGSVTGAVSADVAADNFQKFADARGIDLTINDVTEEDGLYLVSFSTEDGDSYVYVSKDGKNLVSGLVSLDLSDSVSSSSSSSTEIPKSDVPTAELFIMTHCPYGTQAEKGFIPALKALKDVADMKIRFVHYFMHEPEETETPRQVCIREEQEDKFIEYLECFLEGDGVDSGGYIANGNDPSTCMQRVGIDEALVSECVDSGTWEEYYAEDSALSQYYGVQGSPTLVINGVQSSAGRDADSYLNAICNAFNDAPEECTQELSGETPSVYFGWENTGSTSAGSC